MGAVDYSAFDPIFWLHHTMIDRVFAIWQGIYPDSFLNPTVAPFGTFSTPGGTTVDDQYPLAPFHADTQGRYWTSATARETGAFGYTYPELSSNDLIATVNALYGQTAPANILAKRAMHSPMLLGARTSPVGSVSKREDNVDPTKGSAGAIAPSNVYTEWISNIKVDKLAANGTFFVNIFLGAHSPDPFSWSFEPNLVGTHCVFVQMVNDDQSSHIASVSLPVSGSIPLTGALLEKITKKELKSLDAVDVIPYLQSHLSWALADTSDAEIPTNQVPSLKIGVVSSQVTKPASKKQFPKWGAYTQHTDATDGKVGGQKCGGC